MRQGIVALGIGLALALASPASAAAALRWRGCPDVAGAQCAALRVPLDRSGALRGSVTLRVARLRPGARPLVYLSGGPGSAGVRELADLRPVLAAATRGYALVGFDQRGTGRSGLLRCPALERADRLRATRAAARCARRLGPARAVHGTADSVADLEALRRALAAPRLTLLGISYGTKLALAYARAHPSRVERLVLDSVVDPDDADPFALASWQAIPASLRALCPAGCRGVSADPAADLAALAARLRARPLAGGVGTVALVDLVFDADYLPALRAALPAAVASALRHGNAAPLQRLRAIAAPLAELPGPRRFSAARYALVCEEEPLPWPAGLTPASRWAATRARAATLPPGAFGPFSFAEARADVVGLCLRWPDPARPAVAAGGAWPAVPALVLQGGEDLRTPPAASARVAAALPGARRVVVPGVGHAPLAADPTGCAPRILWRFLRGVPVDVRASCPRVPVALPPVPVVPVRLAQLAARSPRARALAALRLTLADLAVVRAPGLGGYAEAPGLAGGRVAERGGRLVLERFAALRDVSVSGAGSRAVGLRLRVWVRGRAAGRVRVDAAGRVRGRLGGRAVRLRVASPWWGRGSATPGRAGLP